MNWTDMKPVAQGLYWLRHKEDIQGRTLEIVRVKSDSGTRALYVLEHGEKRRFPLYAYARDCEWLGPIVFPG